MSKKFIFVLLVIILFFGFKSVGASVVINEIQLNPTSERFIELYNSDTSSVDLTGWYIQRKTQTGSDFGSLVSKTNFENKTIGANDYFLISRNSIENADIVLSNLTLTESNTIQIKNSTREVVDKVGYGDCDGSLTPNPTEGQSIQKDNSGSWVIGYPTPGVSNVASSGGGNNNGNDNTNNDSGNIVFDYNSIPVQAEIVPKIPVRTIVKIPAIEPIINALQNDIKGGESENVVDDQILDKTSDQTQVSGGDLPVTAVLGDTQIEGTNNYLFFGIFGVLLALVGVGVYLIRRKSIPTNVEDGTDFEILDE